MGQRCEHDVRYTPSDVFETFPRPEPTDRLAEIGRTLDTERREIMLRRDLGLTKLYNLVNDPDIADSADADVARMREIHVELDQAVMDAYGWGDVQLDHGFHTYRQMRAVDGRARRRGWRSWTGCWQRTTAGPRSRARRRPRPTTRKRGTTNDHAAHSGRRRRPTGWSMSRTGVRGRPGRTWPTSWSGNSSARSNGPEEVIDGSPDSVYLIGRIAPVKLTAGTDDPTDADTGEPDTDVGDATDAESDRGVPVTAVDDSGAGADEDSGVEDEPQQRGLMIPASMGLRCQIPEDLESFTVTASWGMYESVPEKDPERQRIVRRYKRTPVEIPKPIKVADLPHVGHDGDPAQGQGRAAGRPARRPRARLPADRDRAVQ